MVLSIPNTKAGHTEVLVIQVFSTVLSKFISYLSSVTQEVFDFSFKQQCHDIAEILLMLALNTNQSINQSYISKILSISKVGVWFLALNATFQNSYISSQFYLWCKSKHQRERELTTNLSYKVESSTPCNGRYSVDI